MFEEMKNYLENDGEAGQFGYDDPYADYVNDIYCDAVTEVERQTGEASIVVEPSIQAGMGRVDMYCDKGTTHWDFESECETLAEFAMEADTEEEFKNAIVAFLLGKYEDCISEDDDDDEDSGNEDPDYEGSPEEEYEVEDDDYVDFHYDEEDGMYYGFGEIVTSKGKTLKAAVEAAKNNAQDYPSDVYSGVTFNEEEIDWDEKDPDDLGKLYVGWLGYGEDL